MDMVAPTITTDSPMAIKMNSWQRLAKCAPSIAQSEASDRPSPGVGNPSMLPARSTVTVSAHSSPVPYCDQAWPGALAPRPE
jgi:hypothetical protein